MPSMVIGGNSLTESLETCSYVFTRFPVVEMNWSGEQVSGGYPTAEFTYSMMSATDFAWWATTICAGLPSKTHTSATLYNEFGTPTAYTNVIVHYPTYGSFSGQWYLNVTVRLTQIS